MDCQSTAGGLTEILDILRGYPVMASRDTEHNRRQNFKPLVEKLGGPTAVAKRLKLSGPSYLTQILSGHRPFSEKSARKFEKILGLKSGDLYLDGHLLDGHDPYSVNRDMAQVIAATRAVDSLANARGFSSVSDNQRAAVVEVVFRQAIKHRTDFDEDLAVAILELLQTANE